jgi:serine/threonine protein kinase
MPKAEIAGLAGSEPPAASAIQRLLDLPYGERRIGPFLLVQPLGWGGFAPVWLAREVYGATELRAAAVKLFALGAPLGPSGLVRRQLLEEARALCQVEHPSVVRFYALALDEARGVMGLAMEYVAGTPLDQRIMAVGARGRPSRRTGPPRRERRCSRVERRCGRVERRCGPVERRCATRV